jgi:hypothetical protein
LPIALHLLTRPLPGPSTHSPWVSVLCTPWRTSTDAARSRQARRSIAVVGGEWR